MARPNGLWLLYFSGTEWRRSETGWTRVYSQQKTSAWRWAFAEYCVCLIYKDEWLVVCLYVCMELIQIHISEPIWTRLCTLLPLGLEEAVAYVWTQNSWPLRPFGPFFCGGHCRIMGTRWLPAQPFSAIPLYSWFQLVFVWCHQHDVADGRVTRISLILAGVSLTSRKWCLSRRQSHPPQRHIPYSAGCLRHVIDITFNQAMGPYATALYSSF
jgi:hypothetical protein